MTDVCGPAQNTHTHCGGPSLSSVAAPKMLYSFLGLNHSVSTAGSDFVRAVSQDISIQQGGNQFYGESVVTTLSLFETANAGVDRLISVVDSVVIVDSFVFAGTAGGSEVTGTAPVSAIFDSTTSEGMVLYVPSDGHVDLAQADTVATAGAVGIANEDVSATATGTYLTEGQISRGNWTSIVGTTSLTPGAVYFLSTSTPGGMTTTAPSVEGETIIRIGRALTSTTLDIEISQPICL